MFSRSAKRGDKIAPFYVMELLKRAKQLEATGRDVVHMEIGEPDFPTPQPIIDAAVKYIISGAVKYTPAAGLPQLREHIAEFYRQRYAVKVDEQRIFITPGASGALLLALSASLNPGDGVLLADPGYPCNVNFARFLDCIPQAVPVDAGTQYQLDANLIRRHWHTGTRGVLIASPSNPTGTVIATAALEAAIAEVGRLQGYLYSDEIYHGLVYDEPAETALKFSDKVFVINSFSKYFGMTGWRLGWLIVPEAFIEITEKLAQNLFIASSAPAQYAALAAFTPQTISELEHRRAILGERRDFLYHGLLSLGFAIDCKPQGAFYIYADAKKFTGDSFQFALDFLESEAVAVTPGKDFGSHRADQMLRFAYTTSIDRMDLALQRLSNHLKRINHAN
ncbi:MAG: aminotransferase [Methylobacter sp.]|nr:MAG: aminotransferase [Methylobacter sp.]PPD05551.1 MAG: aminotransferase [Methylobacter sp.]PPD24586.1 MAG: aminotransferase [Methylobacter sp.]PPD32158.1 MAG: aminotransferase [Methylomonas sp.]